MRKHYLLLCVISLSILFISINSAFALQKIIVPDDYQTIKAAVRAANSGDEVFIKKGVYLESVKLKNGVRLIGEDSNSVIIRTMPGARAHNIMADCPDGLIKNIKVEQYGQNRIATANSGICLINSSVEVDGCIIRSTVGSGIVVKDSGKPLIHNCVIEKSGGNGIQVYGKDVEPVIKNTICRENKKPGIYFGEGAKGLAEDNTCIQNNNGILVIHEGTEVVLKNNLCRANNEYGIYVCTGAYSEITGNKCVENKKSGIIIYQMKTKAKIKNNCCTKNEWNGIDLCNGVEALVEENVCEENAYNGIRVNNEWANGILKKNTCTNNKDNGIFFGFESSGVAEGNVCTNNAVNGISVRYRWIAPEIINNKCLDNLGNGIYFGDGSAGTVEGNICQKNKWYGISVNNIWCVPILKQNECLDNEKGNVYRYEGDFGAVRNLLMEEEFVKLDSIAADLRNQRSKSSSGGCQLQYYYMYLSDCWNEYRPSRDDWILGVIDRWIKEQPESITARVLLARTYTRMAWDARGGGWASEVTDEGWLGFNQNLKKAQKVLNDTEELKVDDPEFYRVSLQVAMGLDESDLMCEKLFDKGAAIDLFYYPLYTQRAQTLMSRWGGRRGELEAFANKAVNLTKEKEDYSLYARIAGFVASMFGSEEKPYDDFLKLYNLSYPKIQEGFKDIIKLYPESDYFLRGDRFMACVYKDKERARELFQKTNDQWDAYYCWFSKEEFEEYKEWVYKE
jgi:parallel beta-helix repeat protein